MNCLKFYTIDPGIYSILIFLDKGLRIVSPAHFLMIFQQKCSSCYILLTDSISLPGCLYFLRCWAICVLQLFANQVVTSWILKLALSF